jgi:hypothetical protein
MNVDILANNPDWRWYLLFLSVSLLIIFLGWLIFKYCNVCQNFRVRVQVHRIDNVSRPSSGFIGKLAAWLKSVLSASENTSYTVTNIHNPHKRCT